MGNAGYGLGLSTFVAGVVLVRFSALGSFSGKLTPRLRERIGALVLLGGGSVVVLAVVPVFASACHSPLPGVISAVTQARDLNGDELRPGRPQRRVLARKRLRRPNAGRRH